jgi:hypothetical protein
MRHRVAGAVLAIRFGSTVGTRLIDQRVGASFAFE